jgi:hypothetical protein
MCLALIAIKCNFDILLSSSVSYSTIEIAWCKDTSEWVYISSTHSYDYVTILNLVVCSKLLLLRSIVTAVSNVGSIFIHCNIKLLS